jgi:hypothetical protein
MIILEKTLDGAGTIIEDRLLMTNDEAGIRGEAVKVVAGRLTKCAVGDSPEFVLIKNTAAGTDVKTEYIRVRKDQIFIIDIDGATAIVVGTQTYKLDATGAKLDSANATGGLVKVISVDTVKKIARVQF